MSYEIIHSVMSKNSNNSVNSIIAVQKTDDTTGAYSHSIIKDGVVLPAIGDASTPSLENTNFYTVLS